MPYIYVYMDPLWENNIGSNMKQNDWNSRLCGWLYRSHLISLESAFSGHRFFVQPGGEWVKWDGKWGGKW